MRVVRLNANKIGIGRRATRRLTGFGARAPRFEELVLPKSFEIGNISLNKAVIWWMSDKVDDRKASPNFNSSVSLEGKPTMFKISAALAISLALCTTAYAANGTCYTDSSCTNKIKGKNQTSCSACVGTKGKGKGWEAEGSNDCVKKPGQCP